MQVFIHSGYSVGFHLILSIVLTILAWIPGVIHAFCAFLHLQMTIELA